MVGAGTGTAGDVVADGAAGLAVPRLIERDRATVGDLMPDQSIPRKGITTITAARMTISWSRRRERTGAFRPGIGNPTM